MVHGGLILGGHARAGRQASWGFSAPETGFKYVHASDDGGRSWQHVGLPGVMQWPQIFTCSSGAPSEPPPIPYTHPHLSLSQWSPHVPYPLLLFPVCILPHDTKPYMPRV